VSHRHVLSHDLKNIKKVLLRTQQVQSNENHDVRSLVLLYQQRRVKECEVPHTLCDGGQDFFHIIRSTPKSRPNNMGQMSVRPYIHKMFFRFR